MTGFYGKTYSYKGKVIGVCNTLNPGTYMVGHATTGGHKRMKSIPLCGSAEDAQAMLDEFARAKALPEVTNFYGKAYSYRGKIFGVMPFLCDKLFTIASYDPETGECLKYWPMFRNAQEGQIELDEWAQEEKLSEARIWE